MKLTTVAQLLAVGVFTASLAACSSYSGSNRAAAGTYGSGPAVVETASASGINGGSSSSALDERSRLDGVNKQASANIRELAPHEQTFHFGFDDARLQDIDKEALKIQAQYIADHGKAAILLSGHTDERGSREYNIALGERRARSIAEYLRALGVKPRQIRLVSFGQEKPVALAHNASAWEQNRRVELTYEATA